jgi:hypothetical protein
VAFTVYGRLQVDARSGTTSAIRKIKRARRAKPSTQAVVTAPGVFGVVEAGDGHARVVGLGTDGAIYHKALGAGDSSPRDQGWSRLAGEVTGPVTVLAAFENRIDLLALGADGSLAAQTVSQRQSNRRWRPLGGKFVEPVVAVAGDGGRTELLGLGEEGVVFHRSLVPNDRDTKPDDWTRIGEGVAGSLQAFSSGSGGLAVFALGRDGTVLHKRRGPKRWQPAGTEWQLLGRTPGVRLLAQPVDSGGIGLATLADDFRAASAGADDVAVISSWEGIARSAALVQRVVEREAEEERRKRGEHRHVVQGLSPTRGTSNSPAW